MLSNNANTVMRNDFFLKPVFQGDFGGGLGTFENTGFGGGLNFDSRNPIGDANISITPGGAVVQNNSGINIIKDNLPLILLGIAISILLK